MMGFSLKRLWSVATKEFIQMRRDRTTFAMIVGIPILQLLLFGYAINSNPKNLPTVLVSGDNTPFTRTLINAMENTSYFRFVSPPVTDAEADHLLKTSKAQFVVNIPTNFSRDLVRGLHPNLLITGDATDSMAIGNAIAAITNLSQHVFDDQLSGPLSRLKLSPPSFNLVIHAQYNPELITQFNIVPGLIGVILTMTMTMITAMAITKEYERGTMENLLATPVRPLEVMLGKVIPYIIVGYIQLALILGTAYFVFHVPMAGSLWLLLFAALPFIFANLSVGVTLSTLSTNQLQASQLSIFFFLPSMLLSGFMFPFYGMPLWAQKVGGLLPLTYFLRITRGIMLKGNTFIDIWPNLWPIIVFMVIALAIGVKRYRQTLD